MPNGEHEDKEDAAAEQAAAQVPKEEEVRARVIADLGFDEDADKDRIDKVTAERMESARRLSKTIGQKVKYREAAAKAGGGDGKGGGGDSAAAPIDSMDAVRLAKADLAEEDIPEVIEYARYKKMTIAEALKDKTLKSIIDERVEERRTADATHTRGGARGATKPTGEDILAKAESTGEVPDSDEGLRELYKARQQRKVKKR